MKKKNVSQANTLLGRNESDWSSFPGFRSAFKIQFLEVFVCSSPVFKFLFVLGLNSFNFCSGAITVMFRVNSSVSKMICCFHSG